MADAAPTLTRLSPHRLLPGIHGHGVPAAAAPTVCPSPPCGARMRRGHDQPPPPPPQPARRPERLSRSPLGAAHGASHDAVDAGAPPPHAVTPPAPLPGPPTGAYRGMEHTPQRRYLPLRPPPSASAAGGHAGHPQGGARSGAGLQPYGSGPGLMAPPLFGGVPRQQRHPMPPGHAAPYPPFTPLPSLSSLGVGGSGGGPRRLPALTGSPMGLGSRRPERDPRQQQQQQPLHPPQKLESLHGGHPSSLPPLRYPEAAPGGVASGPLPPIRSSPFYVLSPAALPPVMGRGVYSPPRYGGRQVGVPLGSLAGISPGGGLPPPCRPGGAGAGVGGPVVSPRAGATKAIVKSRRAGASGSPPGLVVGGVVGATVGLGAGFSGSTSSTANVRLGLAGGIDSAGDESVSGSPDHDDKRALRAERNRQSAAASRERKKHHIKELETRAARLSEEVARLQVAEHERVRARVVAEERLQRENEALKHELEATRHQLASFSAFAHCQSCGSTVNWSGRTGAQSIAHPMGGPSGAGVSAPRGGVWGGPAGNRSSTTAHDPQQPPRPSDGGGRG